MLLTQVRYLDGILEWLDQQNTDEASALHGIVDMTRIGTAGHSRGAKLACLQFAGGLLRLATYPPVSAYARHMKLFMHVVRSSLVLAQGKHLREVPAAPSSGAGLEIRRDARVCSI